MRIIFLRSSQRDVEWFREYYMRVFPVGGPKARDQYQRAKALLKTSPHAGHPVEETGVRMFSIPRSPFAFVYRVSGGVIEVLRVWDQRSKPPDKWV